MEDLWRQRQHLHRFGAMMADAGLATDVLKFVLIRGTVQQQSRLDVVLISFARSLMSSVSQSGESTGCAALHCESDSGGHESPLL